MVDWWYKVSHKYDRESARTQKNEKLWWGKLNKRFEEIK